MKRERDQLPATPPCSSYEPISAERLAEIKRIAEEDARRILAPVRKLFREIYGH